MVLESIGGLELAVFTELVLSCTHQARNINRTRGGRNPPLNKSQPLSSQECKSSRLDHKHTAEALTYFSSLTSDARQPRYGLGAALDPNVRMASLAANIFVD